jgi:aryl-alcohol dehydrogenase-like predicted oxidoreductase
MHNPPIEYLDGNKKWPLWGFWTINWRRKIKAYGASLDTYDDMKLFMNTTNATVIEAFLIFYIRILQELWSGSWKEVCIIVKIPLDSGWLSGKYTAESTFHDIRNRWSSKDIQTRAALVKSKWNYASTRQSCTKAISFCLAYDAVSTVIQGMRYRAVNQQCKA